MNSQKLYITQEDLYRFGSSTSSKLTRIRQGEITTNEVNGIVVIVANNQGVSLFNEEGMKTGHLTGWVWEIKQNTNLPVGLRFVKKGSKGHYLLVPVRNMPLSQYVGLLEQVAIYCKKIFKKQA